MLFLNALLFILTEGILSQIITREECESHENWYLPAPVFDQGENLSFEGCGIVPPGISNTSLPPWHVVLGQGDCVGVLISRRAILVNQTPFGLCALNERASATNKNGFWGPLIAFLGQCVHNQKPDCAANEHGFIREVRQVRRLDVYPEDNLFVLIIDRLPRPFPDSVKPVCLFNEDNLMDSKITFYTSLSVTPEFRVTPSVRDCMPDKMMIDRCKRYKFAICMIADDKSNTEQRNALFKVDSIGRYFLRGVAFVNSRNVVHSNLAFHDILKIVDAIVRETLDLHRLPDLTSKVETHAVFAESEKLSYPNCGLETGDTRQKRQVLESADVSTVGFVLGGLAAVKGRHTWHAHITIGSQKLGLNSCGGSLISDKAVLTAAHCLYVDEKLASPIDLHVTLGMWNLSAPHESSRQFQQPQRIILSKGYDPTSRNFRHDVAVLTFSKPFRFTDDVKPICLWKFEEDIDDIADETGVVVGWGLTDGYKRTQVLQRLDLTIRSNYDCFLQNRPFFSTHLKPGLNFCAGNSNGTNACNGDSGGGLMVRRGARWFLRGIVSFGKSKISEAFPDGPVCDPRYYSLFTDIAPFLPWIASVGLKH
ncbi:uncharacterized protein LOC135933960 [Cloeon dipterum]|uniref:uncharacterized protein LOC135933960 n=1 Tax=Cloeon dipterum TaxID=197152 RepID=UPI00321F6E91